MSTPVIEVSLPSAGWIVLKLPVKGDKVKEAEVDLFAFYNEVVDAGLSLDKESKFGAALTARTKWLCANGFDGVSETVTSLAMQSMRAAIDELKKKDPSNESADSPSSTGSPVGPGDTPPDSSPGRSGTLGGG